MPGITNPAEPYFKDGQWGWDGTVWRKLPLVFGYSATISEIKPEVYTSTGFKLIYCGTPAAGYINVLTAISVHFSVGTLSSIYLYLTVDGNDVLMAFEGTPVANVPVLVTGSFIMGAGDYPKAGVTVSAQPCTVGLHMVGYQMAIAE